MSTEIGPGRRTTIKDIAERAGVSKGAVSYALNGRPGVSEETRDRILAIAEELGWYPNRAARALSASRADACGLILARPASHDRARAVLHGVHRRRRGVPFSPCDRPHDPARRLGRGGDRGYRRWFGEHRVDGVFIFDIVHNDPRAEALSSIGLPAVVIGGPLEGHPLPAVWHDEASVVVEAVQYLAALGHRKIARIAGISEFVHTEERTRAFRDCVRELGLDAEVVSTDYTPESGTRATRRLLSAPKPPTAIIFDSDLLAVTGLGVAQQMGFSVPDDLSLIGWDDSLISRVVHPPLTAITRDIGGYGATAAAHLLQVIEGETSADIEVPRGELTPRGSTAPPRGVDPARARAALIPDDPARLAVRSVRESRPLDV